MALLAAVWVGGRLMGSAMHQVGVLVAGIYSIQKMDVRLREHDNKLIYF